MNAQTDEWIERALKELRAFGDIDRPTAARRLAQWRHVGHLSPAERRAVLAHYPEARRRR